MDKLIVDAVLTKVLNKYVYNIKYTITQGFSHYLIEIPSNKGYLGVVEMRKTRNSIQYIVKADGVEYTGNHKIPDDITVVGYMLTSISSMVQTMLIDIDNHIDFKKSTSIDTNTTKIIKEIFNLLKEYPYQITVLTINNTKNIQIKKNNITPESINIILDDKTLLHTSINKVHKQSDNKYTTYTDKTTKTILESEGWL